MINGDQTERRRDALVISVLKGTTTRGTASAEAGNDQAYLRLEKAYLESRLYSQIMTRAADRGMRPQWDGEVRIVRDSYGVPHVSGQSEEDLMFGAGFAQAQDRLWQMDYRRRQADGTLAEIFGKASLKSDIENRTLGHRRSAEREFAALSPSNRGLLEAYARGVNAWIEMVLECLPVEFDVLGYSPQPWLPTDTLAVLRWFWASLTLRLDQIVGPERILRSAGPETAQWFFRPEAPEYIVPGLANPAALDDHGGGDGFPGSNNWVAGPSKTTTGKPVLCADPHWPLFFPSMWYEQHLSGAGVDCIGAAYPGAPPIIFGRTRGVAWGRTNNVTSTRDLYHEEAHPQDRELYLDSGRWFRFGSVQETIDVRDGEKVTLTIRTTVRGPVVNDIISPVAETGDGPISLKWVGHEVINDFDSLWSLNRANSAREVRVTLAAWRLSVWNAVYADSEGNFGYQMSGTIPRRNRITRGTRSATDPDDSWAGYTGTDDLPGLHNPPRGWAASANNTPAPQSQMPGMYGAYADGYRMRRISGLLDAKATLTPEEVRDIQSDNLDPRALELKDQVANLLEQSGDGSLEKMAGILRSWNATYASGQVGASIWTAFWPRFVKRVGAVVLPDHAAVLMSTLPGHIARTVLLDGLVPAHFADVAKEVRAASQEAFEFLENALGADPAHWEWQKAQSVWYQHPLAYNLELSRVFNLGPFSCTGGTALNRRASRESTGGFVVAGGVSYRLYVNLAERDRAWGATLSGQSGQPGSRHYADRVLETVDGTYHPLMMDWKDIEAAKEHEIVITRA